MKRFATEARNILMQGVFHRIQALGFQADGTPIEEPQLFAGGATFMGDTVSEDFYNKWLSLKMAVITHSLEEIAEEAAYTWFNRLVAIRIMVKNNLIAPILQYESEGVMVPLLVSEARQGRMPSMSADEQRKLSALLDDDSKTAEQFRILIVAFCHANPVINSCFGQISDYTELLFDYKTPELIGWLYQYYIAEKKDDVFASFKKGKKAEAKDIPAATQIFTPNWIVKYMVQNTVGRIYLDNNPYEKEIQKKWKYLVEPTEPTPQENILHYNDLTELKFADLACGSGHILNEGFDILYDLYQLEGYSRKEAIENIFKYNLTGVDIDTRAKQLAQFALLLKACQKDSSFADAHLMPRVLDMPEPYHHKEQLYNLLPHFLIGGNQQMVQEIIDAIELMDQAKNLGSIMKFNISEQTRNAIAVRMEEYGNEKSASNDFEQLKIRLRIILALTEKYAAVVMNPPYMGAGNMNTSLSDYVKKNYENGKADLYTTFMYLAMSRLSPKGKMGLVTMESWMFLSSFQKLRAEFLSKYTIDSLSHFDWHIMHIAFGTASYIITNAKFTDFIGTYSYLYRTDMDWEHDIPLEFPNKRNGRFKQTSQTFFDQIPGHSIGYWVSEKIRILFSHSSISDNAVVKIGMGTGKNDLFLRKWWEIPHCKMNTALRSTSELEHAIGKYFPYNKGGEYRLWYGNLSDVCWYDKEGRNKMEHTSGHRENGGFDYYFHEGISWSFISSGRLGVRYLPTGCLFDVAGSSLFSYDVDIRYILGLLSTTVSYSILKILNPTINFQAGNIKSIPFIYDHEELITDLVSKNITISRTDWDAHETSWDFKTNSLLKCRGGAIIEEGETADLGNAPDLLKTLFYMYKAEWEQNFMQLHSNEEELNRQFIEIYGLQDELTPDVPLDEITILQQGEISIEDNHIVWHPDIIMKQLISYAVGCMMGRYSLDKDGLILANQGDGLKQFHELVPDSKFEPDDDGIIPLMSAQSDFADNATVRFKQWLAVAFGEETLVENLNFIEASLGKSIDDYFVKDFWKDHKKMYQNRPIYWLFSSKKGAFQCLTYMHRMDAYTAERVRTKYLLPHIEWLLQKQKELTDNLINLTSQERRQLDNITKQIQECREYHDRLHVIADHQIGFDLDDGVVVNYAKFGDVLAIIK